LDRSDAATLGRMQEDLTYLLENGARPAGSPAEHSASLYLAGQLQAIGLDVTTRPVSLPTGETSQNISAVIGGGARRVLVGAHYDSVELSPGADDNGSGSVILLELARRLGEAPVDGLEVTIVLFGAEEVLPGYSRNDHHFGSRQMADELIAAADLPDEMLSVDMVGLDDTILAAFYGDTDQAAAARLVSAGASVGIDIVLSSRGDISDHEAFARAGVPAVMMWRPSNPGYHSAADTEVNWDHMLDNLTIVEAWLALQL
jgi:Zn-dependent M28 family amino/carboxypeptidase